MTSSTTSTWWYIEELMGDYAKNYVFLPPLTGPKGVFFTGQDDKGMWLSFTEDESRAQYNRSAGELHSLYEVYGPKLILAEHKEYLSKSAAWTTCSRSIRKPMTTAPRQSK